MLMSDARGVVTLRATRWASVPGWVTADGSDRRDIVHGACGVVGRRDNHQPGPGRCGAGLLPTNWWNDRPILPSPPQVVIATWNGLFGYR